MKNLTLRAKEFAERMSEDIFIKRAEDDFVCAGQVPDKFIIDIVDDPEHIKNIKSLIYTDIFNEAIINPEQFLIDDNGDFMYSWDACYDYCYIVDNYIETQYEKEKKSDIT